MFCDCCILIISLLLCDCLFYKGLVKLIILLENEEKLYCYI